MDFTILLLCTNKLLNKITWDGCVQQTDKFQTTFDHINIAFFSTYINYISKILFILILQCVIYPADGSKTLIIKRSRKESCPSFL